MTQTKSKGDKIKMGILENLGDKAVEKFAKKETIRVPYEQIVEILKDEFIAGADDDFLQKVLKTSKGGNLFTSKKLESKSGRYLFHVGNLQRGIIFGKRKCVWIQDNETNKFYQLDKDRYWKKFYKSADAAIKMEKINRSR